MSLFPLKETSGGFQDEKLEERLDSPSHACVSQAHGQIGRDFLDVLTLNICAADVLECQGQLHLALLVRSVITTQEVKGCQNEPWVSWSSCTFLSYKTLRDSFKGPTPGTFPITGNRELSLCPNEAATR